MSTIITAQPDTPYIEIEREFAAPAERVFRAWTEADLVAQWLGPRELKMDVEEYDARTGGSYRYTHTDAEGNAYRFRGVFHTVASAQLIIQTFEFEGTPNEVCIETATFEEVGGRTKVRQRSVFPSVAARDGAIASGMEHGIRDSMDRLDELVGA